LLKKAGIDVEYDEYKGMMHGFVSLNQGLKEGRRAIRKIADFVDR